MENNPMPVLTCKTCGNPDPLCLFDGSCRKCFDARPTKELDLPTRKPKGILTKKRKLVNRRGAFIVRVREGVYYNSSIKKPLVSRELARVYQTSKRADNAAKRLKGKVENA